VIKREDSEKQEMIKDVAVILLVFHCLTSSFSLNKAILHDSKTSLKWNRNINTGHGFFALFIQPLHKQGILPSAIHFTTICINMTMKILQCNLLFFFSNYSVNCLLGMFTAANGREPVL